MTLGEDLLWVLECLPEIESDMSVFHRVDDIYTMGAPVLFRRVRHLPAYNGALLARLRREQAEPEQRHAAAPVTTQALDEDALWAQHRQSAYAKYLKPGETPREVSLPEGMKLAAQAFSGVR